MELTGMRLNPSLPLVAATLFVASPALAQRKAPDGAKILIVSGGQRQHHGYREQAFYLAELLENTKKFEVTIIEDAAVLETPAVNRYDALVMLADRRDPEFKLTKAQQEAIFNFVRSGRGYVSIHGADNAAPDWLPEWRDMLGGVFSHVGLPDSKTRKGTYSIKIADTSHAITRGLADFELADELYYNLQMRPGVEPLATTEFDGKTWPVAWTREFGQGRVFHTPLGHRNFGPNQDDPMRNPNLGRLVVQGVEWVTAGARKTAPGERR
jgi:type 1 glutamine amidotransferase